MPYWLPWMLATDTSIALLSMSEVRLFLHISFIIPLTLLHSYQNEDEVGAALQKWLANNPTYQRADIFITTKVWPQNLEPEDVEWSLDESLRNLQVDYVDSFLIHWPFAVERTEDHKVKLDAQGKVSYSLVFQLSLMQGANDEPLFSNKTLLRRH